MNIRFTPPVGGLIASAKSIFGIGKENKDIEALEHDKDSSPLFREDIIAFVHNELEKRKGDRNALELQWQLNANFLMGNQNCDINISSSEISSQISTEYDWMEHEVFNRIAPLIETRRANLKKLHYDMRVNPATNELDDYDKAQIATALLQHTQTDSDFNSKYDTMISWLEVTGNCFWMSWWDKDKGEEVGREIIIDDDGAETTKRYFEGDIDYGLLSPYEVYPENLYLQKVESQRSIIISQVKTVDDIYDIYGVEVEGRSIDTFSMTPTVGAGGLCRENTVMTLGHKSTDNSEEVITYFERPSRRYPDGRMIIVIGADNLIYYGKLPYDRIPIVQTICKEVPGQFFGKSVIEELIPLQRAYNACKNRIHEYIQRISIQSYAVESGSIDIDEYEEKGLAPGELLEYNPGSTPPTPLRNGDLPGEVMAEMHNIATDMEYVAGVSQLMVTGNTPSGMTSGVAIQNLQEIDDTRMSLTGDNIRNSVIDLAKLWLEIFKKYANTKRVMEYVGTNNIHQAIVWDGDDITSYDIEFTTENELLKSEDMQKQKFIEMYNMGMFTDENGKIPERFKATAIKYITQNEYSELISINQLQMQAAQRENVFFEKGTIPEVSEFDNHEVHLDEHMRYYLQMKFQLLKMNKPEYALAFENHMKQHQQALQDAAMQQIQLMQGGNQNG